MTRIAAVCALILGFCLTETLSFSSVYSSARHVSPLRRTVEPLFSSVDTFNGLSDSKPTKRSRFMNAIPRMDALDKNILGTAVPSMINMAVVPLVNAVDTFWVGRMGVALALAGQAAANSAFFTLYFLVAFLPTITAPMVAEAVASGDMEAAQERVCESLFLCNLFGGLGTILLVVFPRVGLRMVLPEGAPALEYAAPYLRWRALSMAPALLTATGFAAYRGLLNTVTPLKVSLFTNALNLFLDPLLIFNAKLGFIGAALATAISEGSAGLIYLQLLLKRKLVTWKKLVKPPSWKKLVPILQGGSSVLARQAAINVAIISAARRAQVMDPSGVSAAAYGIVMNLFSVGIVMHIAIQSTAAALIPATRAKEGDEAARNVADRMFSWGTLIGALMGTIQYLALPFLVPLFSTLPEVQEAVRAPAIISSFVHFINGIAFAGEGAMLGLGCFRDLALLTAVGTLTLLGLLSTPLGNRLDGILVSLAIFNIVQGVSVLTHYLKFGPLAKKKTKISSA